MSEEDNRLLWKNLRYRLLENLDDPFVVFTVGFMDKHAYFNVRSFRKYYHDHFNLEEDRSVAIKIGRLTKALKEMSLIVKWNCNTYKNLHRGHIMEELKIQKYQNDNTPELE